MARFSAFESGLTKTSLCLWGTLFVAMPYPSMALDEYMPLAPRVMEIDLGLDRGTQTGIYDDNWDHINHDEKNNPLSMPLQGKFGLVNGLEGAMAANFILNDIKGESGFDRPVLSLKYADSSTHIGGFLGITLPIGFEDVMDGGNYASMIFGLMYALELPHYRLLTNASYTYNTEDETDSKIDQLHFFAKPEYPLPLKALTDRKQYLGVYLGLNYDFSFNAVTASESSDTKRHLFSIMPGLNYTFNRIISTELTGTLPLAGRNVSDVSSIRLQVYFTLEEALYNALSG